MALNKIKTVVSIDASFGDRTRVSLWMRGKEIFFETRSYVSPSGDFAIWAALPIAMRFGGVLQINGATSPIARDEAERLSIIWSTWMPKSFRPVRVVSKGYPDSEKGISDKALMLYSGGVDSTFALKRYVEEGNSNPDLLTIHGMDYRRED